MGTFIAAFFLLIGLIVFFVILPEVVYVIVLPAALIALAVFVIVKAIKIKRE